MTSTRNTVDNRSGECCVVFSGEYNKIKTIYDIFDKHYNNYINSITIDSYVEDGVIFRNIFRDLGITEPAEDLFFRGVIIDISEIDKLKDNDAWFVQFQYYFSNNNPCVLIWDILRNHLGMTDVGLSYRYEVYSDKYFCKYDTVGTIPEEYVTSVEILKPPTSHLDHVALLSKLYPFFRHYYTKDSLITQMQKFFNTDSSDISEYQNLIKKYNEDNPDTILYLNYINKLYSHPVNKI